MKLLGGLRRHPWYTMFASMTVGTSAAIPLVLFVVMNAVWLKPSPFQAPERLVAVLGGAFASLNSPGFTVFESVAGQVSTTDQSSGLRPLVRLAPVARDLEGVLVTSGYFSLLGIPVQGRDFRPSDDQDGAETAAILSHELWANSFGSDPRVIGSLVPTSTTPVRIVGVAAIGFRGARIGERADIWLPSRTGIRFAALPGAVADLVPLMVYARLRPGDVIPEVERRLNETLALHGSSALKLTTLESAFGTPISRTVAINDAPLSPLVVTLTLLSLVCGCVTLVSIVVAHYDGRKREFAIRFALGASKPAIAVQLFSETVAILSIGAGVATLLSYWILAGLPALTLPNGLQLARLDTSVDWRVVAAALVSAASPLVVSTCYQVSRLAKQGPETKVLGTWQATAGSQGIRLRLLCGQVLLTTTVLVTAALFVTGVRRSVEILPGFEVDRTMFATVTLSTSPTLASGGDWRAFANERTQAAVRALSQLPEVDSVAMGRRPWGVEARQALSVPTRVELSSGERDVPLGLVSGSANLLSTLGIAVLSGRDLEEGDANSSPASTVITEELAESLWPSSSPLGQIVTVGPRRQRLLIVGVAANFSFGSVSAPAVGSFVTVNARGQGAEPQFVVRMKSERANAELIESALRSVLPEASRIDVRTGDGLVLDDVGEQRVGAWLFSGFGAASLVLGLAGVFGFVYYVSMSRWRELAIRAALGASPKSLFILVFASSVGPVASSIAGGLLLALLVAEGLKSQLIGIETFSVVVYASVAVLLLLSTCLAALSAGAWLLREQTYEGLSLR